MPQAVGTRILAAEKLCTTFHTFLRRDPDGPARFRLKTTFTAAPGDDTAACHKAAVSKVFVQSFCREKNPSMKPHQPKHPVAVYTGAAAACLAAALRGFVAAAACLPRAAWVKRPLRLLLLLLKLPTTLPLQDLGAPCI
jgi:hypothetical protein